MAIFGRKLPDVHQLMRDKQYKKAIKVLEYELKRNPNDFKDRLRLAEAYEGAGRIEDAVKVFIEEGESCVSGGSTRQGIVLLKKALRLDPENKELSDRVEALQNVRSGGQRSGVFSFDLDDDSGEEEAEAEADEGEAGFAMTEDAPAAETPVEEAEAEAEMPPEEEAPSEIETEPEVAEEEGEVPAEEEPVEAAAEAPEEEPEVEVEEVTDIDLDIEAESEPAEGDGPMPAEGHGPEPAEGEVDLLPDDTGGGELVDDSAELELEFDRDPADEEEFVLDEEAPEDSTEEELPADDPIDLLSELFPGLTPDEAGQIVPMLNEVQLKPGDILLKEGETGDSLFLVMEGCLEASARYEKVNLHLGELQRCDVIGEVAFLKGVPRTATIMAVEPSRLLELSKNAVHERLQQDPELMERLESILEERVNRTIDLLKQSWERD